MYENGQDRQDTIQHKAMGSSKKDLGSLSSCRLVICSLVLLIWCFFISSVTCLQMLRQSGDSPQRYLYPLIFVPGDGGSQFEAMLDKPSVVHSWCTKKTDYWFSLWLNLEFLVPGVTGCFADNMKLQYDSETHTTSNQPGVSLRIPGFGNTSSIEYMDPSETFLSTYFVHIISALEKNLGYKRNINMRGAPYDFRKAPNEMGIYTKNVVTLIEETYSLNNNRPVVLIGHSLGCLYMLYMLNHQSQAWKDKYVRAFISLAGPYGGAVKTVKMMASGYNLDITGLDELTLRDEQRSMPSSAFLLPYDTFWNNKETLIYAPTGNYTVGDYPKFLEAVQFPLGVVMRKDTEQLIKNLDPPGVEVFCLYGIDVPTPESYIYATAKTGTNWYDSQPSKILTGQGDGTVNLRSLQGCQRWVGQQKQSVTLQELPNAEHLKMLADGDLIKAVQTIVFNL